VSCSAQVPVVSVSRHQADLLLKEIAEQHAIRLRPCGTFSHQLFSGLVKRSRPLRQRLPLELQHHAGAVGGAYCV